MKAIIPATSESPDARRFVAESAEIDAFIQSLPQKEQNFPLNILSPFCFNGAITTRIYQKDRFSGWAN